MNGIKSNFLPGIFITLSVVLVLMFVFSHHKTEERENFSVSNSTVFSFSYNTTTTTTTFSYDLLLFVYFPYSYVSFDYVQATASYLNHTFASKPDETLVQGFTGQLIMRFNGHYVALFTEDQLLTLHKDHMAGLYNITVTIWPSDIDSNNGKTGVLNNVVLCYIQVPLQPRVFCRRTNDDC
ncbi:hypothetical protein DEO72_LG8g2837 [Vigna unguiculata]|uniref:Uncharacterized protein n=1 Tax=Vigna unguiculata TaxID=3917 RepID=A0A4D6MTJ7_VIGUN|nr:hypothetical protein DEO72_LG8g2837 [Vigna unguiculata]